MSTININPDGASIRVSPSKRALLSVLAALNEGQFSQAVNQFDDLFTFTDHALGLEFIDKRRLIEFFHKSRELFPDTMMEADDTSDCGDHATVEWKLTSSHVLSYGSLQRRVSLSLRGATIVHVENGRIRQWSEYYDQLASPRTSVATFFTGWTEY
jgi:ketosteroid isomerase-like protein